MAAAAWATREAPAKRIWGSRACEESNLLYSRTYNYSQNPPRNKRILDEDEERNGARTAIRRRDRMGSSASPRGPGLQALAEPAREPLVVARGAQARDAARGAHGAVGRGVHERGRQT